MNHDETIGGQTPLAHTLRRHMTIKGYSLSRLARDAGISRSTLHHWRSGRVGQPYQLEHLLKVAAVLGLSRIQTSRLLHDAGFPTLSQLLSTEASSETLQLVLETWRDNPRPSLPGSLTTFVGRQAAILSCAELLSDGTIRLLTLTGPGGTGKTRLALEIAGELADSADDGIFLVPLVTVRHPAQVPAVTATALGLRESPGSPIDAVLRSYLRDRELLLVLDNLEQIDGSGPLLVDLLRGAPRLKIIATSRRPLDVSVEHIHQVEPFPTPLEDADQASVEANPAAQLFEQRARAASGSFELSSGNTSQVATLCGWLDGLPLAIELAAARMRDYTLNDLTTRFRSRLELSTSSFRDMEQRHRTLRTTIQWSYDLLDQDSQQLFNWLGVFAGDWTSADAMAVCRPGMLSKTMTVRDGLEKLQHASLIQASSSSERWTMLETIREFALEELELSGNEGVARQRHAENFLAEIASHPPYVPLTSPPSWIDEVEETYDNLSAALGWAIEADQIALASQIASALWPYWDIINRWSEGWSWIEQLLPTAPDQPTHIRAQLLTAAIALTAGPGAFQEALLYADRALIACEEAGDDHGMALVRSQQGWIEFTLGRHEDAVGSYQLALECWTQAGIPLGIAAAHNALASISVMTLQFDPATQHLDAAEEIYEQHDDALGRVRVLMDRGFMALLQSDVLEAIRQISASVEEARSMPGHPTISASLFFLGYAFTLAGQLDRARQCQHESLTIRQTSGEYLGLSYNLLGIAAIASRSGHFIEAAQLSGAARGQQEHVGIALNPAADAVYRHEIGIVREQLGDDAFEEAFASGAALPLRDAIALSLEESTSG